MCLGIPGRVVALYRTAEIAMARVDFGGVVKEVCIEHVPETEVGEYVLVHVGFALSRIDEEEAGRIFELLRSIPLLDEREGIEVPSWKYLDEYRDGAAARKLVSAIDGVVTRAWTIMEVCGGQTHSIVRHGIDEVLPAAVTLVHGPGCPVCVTPVELIDRAHAIALRPGVTLCSFGDMLRVPGSRGDLLQRKAAGADVRIVYSPLDAVALARSMPHRQVVLFAVGFETTAPATATALALAKREDLRNFSALVSHVLTPPAVAAILQANDNRVQGFLGPGHVCTVMGYREYEPIARRFGVPIVITGFEPVDLLEGILLLLSQLESGRASVENQYRRVVREEGNVVARRLIEDVFEVCDRKWRGVGTLPKSGLRLSAAFRAYDAERIFDLTDIQTEESTVCISGQILRGTKKPGDCPAFGTTCTPLTPLGATMVSSEGACAAYHAYRGPEQQRRLLPVAAPALAQGDLR